MLWKHQSDILPSLRKGNFLLAWEPGVGKTRPALVAAKELGHRNLYVCPAAIREQIAAVAASLGYKHPQILRREDRPYFEADLVICSYDFVSNPKTWFPLFKAKWDTLILDEAHNLKNTTTKRTRAVFGSRIGPKSALYLSAERTWALTGTPVLNDPTELWPVVSRLFPEALEKLGVTTTKEWMYRFCVVKDTPYGPKILGGKNLGELADALVPFMDVKKSVDALPDMPPLVQDMFFLDGRDIIDYSLLGQKPELIARLREVLGQGDPDLEGLEVALATMRHQIGMLKVGQVIKQIEDELDGGQDKIVVFYQHTAVGEKIRDNLGRFHPLLVNGATKNKSDVVKSFAENPVARVLLGQINTMEGLDGLQVSNRCILAEYSWVPGVNTQAVRRLARGGQKRPVRASYAVLRDSLDEQVLRACIRKQKIVDQIMDGVIMRGARHGA